MTEQIAAVLKSRAFTDRMFRRLFIPTVLSAIVFALGDVADALFIGIRIGEVGLATMTLVTPIYMIYNILDIGIAVGTSIRYTQAVGKGKAKEGLETFSAMLTFALAVSILIAAIGLLTMPFILKGLGAGPEDGKLWNYTKEYLQIMFIGAPFTFLFFLLYYCIRCDDAEKLASIGYAAGFFTDVVLSAVFVIVLKMDVRGAIIATVIGKIVGLSIFMIHFTRKWAILRFRFVKPIWKEVGKTLKTGMSSSIGYLGKFIALLAINNILMKAGGENALAEFNIVMNVSYIALVIYTALGDTIQPLVGTFFAEHNREAIDRIVSLAARIGVISGVFVGILFAIFAPYVCAVFGLSGDAIYGGAFAVRMFTISIVPAGVNIVWSYYFQTIKRELLVFLVNQMRSFIFFLLFAAVLTPFGVQMFWFSFVLAELCTIAVWTPVYFKNRHKMSDKVFTYLLDTNSTDISDLMDKSEQFCEENDAMPMQSYCVTLCIEEVCQAIIENAFNQNGDEYIQVTLRCEPDGTMVIHIRDNAVSFNPFSMKTGQNYDDEEHLAALGIQMVKAKSKSFFYRRYFGFNTLTVEV